MITVKVRNAISQDFQINFAALRKAVDYTRNPLMTNKLLAVYQNGVRIAEKPMGLTRLNWLCGGDQ